VTADLAKALRDADHCHGQVTRGGEDDACGKPPVALIESYGEFEGYWPACAWHANRYGTWADGDPYERSGNHVVPLTEIVQALVSEHTSPATPRTP
jgi:hypothetical protein